MQLDTVLLTSKIPLISSAVLIITITLLRWRVDGRSVRLLSIWLRRRASIHGSARWRALPPNPASASERLHATTAATAGRDTSGSISELCKLPKKRAAVRENQKDQEGSNYHSCEHYPAAVIVPRTVIVAIVIIGIATAVTLHEYNGLNSVDVLERLTSIELLAGAPYFEVG